MAASNDLRREDSYRLWSKSVAFSKPKELVILLICKQAGVSLV